MHLLLEKPDVPFLRDQHYDLCWFVPQTFRLVGVRSIPFFFRSCSEEWPVSFWKSVCIAFETHVFTVHRHEDDSIFEFLKSDSFFCHLPFNLMEQFQCCVSWENGIPSMRRPASKEITSDSVELRDTDVCFLHIQLIRTNVWLPKIHRILPSPPSPSSHPRLTSSRQGLQQSLSLGTIPIDSAAPYCPHGNIVDDHSCDECKRSNMPSVCHRLSSILQQLVQVCLQTKACRLPNLAK